MTEQENNPTATPANVPLNPAPTGQAALAKPATVELWGYSIPTGPDAMTFGEMQLAYEAVTTGRSMQDFGFMAEYLAEAITNRCNLDTPLTPYEIRRKPVDVDKLTAAFTALIEPFTAKLEAAKGEQGKEAGRP